MPVMGADPSGLQDEPPQYTGKTYACPKQNEANGQKDWADVCNKVVAMFDDPTIQPGLCRDLKRALSGRTGGTVVCFGNGTCKCLCLFNLDFIVENKRYTLVPGQCPDFDNCGCQHEQSHYSDPKLSCSKAMPCTSSGTREGLNASECEAGRVDLKCLEKIDQAKLTPACKACIHRLYRSERISSRRSVERTLQILPSCNDSTASWGQLYDHAYMDVSGAVDGYPYCVRRLHTEMLRLKALQFRASCV